MTEKGYPAFRRIALFAVRQKSRLPPPSERKIVTKETHQGCLSFAIHHPGAFMPPAVPRRPQAAESKPPRPGPHLLPRGAGLRARPPLRPRGDGGARAKRRPGTRPKRTTGGTPPTRPPGGWGAPPSIDQSRGRAGEGQGLAATPGAAGGPRKQTAAPGERPQPARRAARRAPQARPLVADHLGGGRPPPSDGRRRKLTGADRRRPTAGPAPHHQAPTTTSHRGPEPGGGRPGQAGQFSCRRIPFSFGPIHGAKQRRRGDSPEPGRRGGGPCARRPGGTGGGRYGAGAGATPGRGWGGAWPES